MAVTSRVWLPGTSYGAPSTYAFPSMVAAKVTALASSAVAVNTAGRPRISGSVTEVPDSSTVTTGGVVSTVTVTAAEAEFPRVSVATAVSTLAPSVRGASAEKAPPETAAATPLTATPVRCGSDAVPVTSVEAPAMSSPSAGEVMVTVGGSVSRVTVVATVVARPTPSRADHVRALAPSASAIAWPVNGRVAPSGAPRVAGTPLTLTSTASADTRPVGVIEVAPTRAPFGGWRSDSTGSVRSMEKSRLELAAPPAVSVAVTPAVCEPSVA